jgi:hypothetical protein
MMEDFVAAYERLLRRLEADDAAWGSRTGSSAARASARSVARIQPHGRRLPAWLLHTAFEAGGPAGPRGGISARHATYGDLNAIANRIARWLRVGRCPMS